MGQHLEELKVLNLGVPQDVPECVSEGGFNPQQGLKVHPIDSLEAGAIEMGEVLDLKFPDEFLVGLRQKHFAEGAIRINFKDLLVQFLLDELISHIVVNNVVFPEISNNFGFFLPLGGVDVKDGVHLENVKVHGLLVVERVPVKDELILLDKLFGFYEFVLQE